MGTGTLLPPGTARDRQQGPAQTAMHENPLAQSALPSSSFDVESASTARNSRDTVQKRFSGTTTIGETTITTEISKR